MGCALDDMVLPDLLEPTARSSGPSWHRRPRPASRKASRYLNVFHSVRPVHDSHPVAGGRGRPIGSCCKCRSCWRKMQSRSRRLGEILARRNIVPREQRACPAENFFTGGRN